MSEAAWARRLIRLFLRLYSGEWRGRYGAEVEALVAERLSRSSSARRPWLLVRELWGLGVSAVRVRWRSGRSPAIRGKGVGGMGTWWQDIRFGYRALRRSPAFAWTAVGVLAVGIGANVAIFSAVNAVLLRPLPFPDADRLVMVWEHNPEKDWWQETAAPANYLDWRDQVEAFEDVAAHASWGTDPSTYVASGEARELHGVNVTGNYFRVLGVSPVLGRDFRWDETWDGADDVVLLSHGAWVEHFGGDRDVVGRTIELDDEAVEVVGVMPPGFSFPARSVDYWKPWGWDAGATTAVWFRRAHYIRPIARLAPDVPPEQADAQLQAVAGRLQAEYPETNRAMGAGMTPLREFLVGDTDTPLLILMGAVALVLLVACANVGNLLLVRTAGRSRELAVRRAIGAGRSRLVRQLLTESLGLSVVGGALGVALGWVGVRALSGLRPVELEGVGGLVLDERVVAFAVGLTLLSGLLFGLLPALRGVRGDLAGNLRDGGRTGVGRGGLRTVSLLVMAEVAVALLLVTGAGLLTRSFIRLHQEDGGFRVENVMSFRLNLPGSYETDAEVVAFWDRLLERLGSTPGVRDAGLVSVIPLLESGWTSDFSVDTWEPERAAFEVHHRTASPGYYRVMDVPLLAGRLPDATDDPGNPVILVNEALVRAYFQDQDPIGRRIANDRVPGEGSTWRTIIGVVGNERIDGLARPPRPEIIEPARQDPGRSRRVVLRTVGPAEQVLPSVRAAVRELDPRLPISSPRSMRSIKGESLVQQEFLLTLLSLFAAVALVLAMVGVYGVTAQAARRRTREIGIRIALGAGPGPVHRLILGQGMRPAVAGVVLGLLGAAAAVRVLRSVLYRTEPTDPLTLTLVPITLVAVALLACYLPARRATRLDPARTLRAE